MKRPGLVLQWLAPLAVFALLYLGWQAIAFNYRSILPPFGDVTGDFLSRPGFYGTNLLATLHAALTGFAIGSAVAILLAVLAVYFASLRAAILPVALLLNVTPIVAISPALIVAFGFNAVPHIIVAALAAFFPMLINAMSGLRQVDREALDVFHAMSASPVEVFLHLRLPGALPQVFAGAKLGITAAMVGAIVSEFTGTSRGIGAAIVMATTYLNLSQMWVAIFVSALTTLALVGLVVLLEKLIVRW
ncbi:ABC transporter permease [Pseudooceanicola nanhaiensis]|uniref:ABC transporter permease n=1 Tax=Pseudooceanicola nanhaiensis TaxID=375761 RepID=UPI001CD62634|nr:ABC transporter permease subunit [Pseudooceanicola nanhaiensis]MCA0920771.1 ABC transporter permease subunit [Pseudooceanicola nanhaiensis]